MSYDGTYQTKTNDAHLYFREIFHPKNFDIVFGAARDIVGFDLKKWKFLNHHGNSFNLTSDEFKRYVI